MLSQTNKASYCSIRVIEEANQTSAQAWRDRLQALKNIPPVLRIVWNSGPWVVGLGLVFRLLTSFVPVGAATVGKYILDTVTLIAQHRAPYATQSTRLWWLVGLEFGLVVAGNVFGRIVDYYDRVLADRYTRYVSVQVMEHASSLDLQAYENPVFYDRLERARVQATDRLGNDPVPWTVVPASRHHACFFRRDLVVFAAASLGFGGLSNPRLLG